MDNIQFLYQHYTKAYKVSTDSRKIGKDAVFFALKGEHFDGNDFALQVAKDGIASLVVADRQDLSEHERILKVDDTLKTLQELAKYHRQQMKAKVIGITGTNGKTTTKELISAVLSRRYRLIHTEGNFNNHLGVPLTLLSIKPDTEIAVVEMGANHPGEIDQLAHFACPDCGLITNIGKAHLEGFGSFQGVVNTKTELYRFIKEHGGFIFVNRDNSLLWQYAQDQKHVSYGSSDEADYRTTLADCAPYLCVEWNGHKAQTKLVGTYNFENAAAAIAVGRHFRVSDDDIHAALEAYTPTNSRSQVVESGKNRIIMDAYNANPTSMQASIRNFINICRPEHLLILGDMGELGEASQTEHQTILNLIDELHFNAAYLVGPNFGALAKDPRWTTFKDVNELIQHLQSHPVEGRDILVKGSHSVQLEKVLPLL